MRSSIISYLRMIAVSALLCTLSLWLLGPVSLLATKAPPQPIPEPEPLLEDCGTQVDQDFYMQEGAAIEQGQAMYGREPASNYYVAVTFHIVRSSSGTGGLNPSSVTTIISALNTRFAVAQIQFFLSGDVDFIDDNYYFSNPSAWQTLSTVRPVAGTINLYFTPVLPYAGLSGSIGSNQTYSLINNLYATNGSTVPHEVGHIFYLYHTHQAGDCPISSNCQTLGDRVCDTPADPDLYGHVNSSCVYDDYANPAANGCPPTPRYTPDTHNLMSYSFAACRTVFTTGQVSRMRHYLETSLSFLIQPAPPQVYYVSEATGNDNNDGSYGAPFKTLGKALSVAVSEDSILVRPGTYTGPFTIDGKSIGIRSTNGPRSSTFITGPAGSTLVTFTNGANGSLFQGFRLLGGAVGIQCNNSAVSIKRCIFDFQTTPSLGAIWLTGNSPATLINNTVLGSAKWGILTASSAAPTMKNNMVVHNKSGIRCESGAAQPNLSYNDVWGNLLSYFDGVINYSNISNPGTGSINRDPYLDSTYWLVTGSPCVDAGDPDPSYNDPDGTRSCMGAIETATSRVFTVPTNYPTIMSAIGVASSGWVINVNPGTYYESLRFNGKTIKVVATGGPTQTFLRPDPNWWFIVNNEFGEGPGTELSGFDITSPYCMNSIQACCGSNLLIQNCVFHDFPACSYNWDIIRTGSGNSGMLEVKNCVFYGNRLTACIGVWPGANARIINNTFYNNNRAFYSNSYGTVAENNVVTNSIYYGVSGKYATLDYNDVWSNNPNYAAEATAGVHDLSADPLFVSAGGNDFHIQSGSPCIDTGDPNPIYNDPDGSRNDMGAYPLSESELQPPIEWRATTSVPKSFSLDQNRPNPFNPTTEIRFSLPEASQVRLEVYNILGQKVATLANDYFEAGNHTVVWNATSENGNSVASGLYLYRLTAGTFTDVKKMTLLK